MSFAIFATVCLLFVCAFLIVRTKNGAGPNALILKSLASMVFVIAGVYATFKVGLTIANLFIVIGLLFAMFGDVVLDLKVAYPEHNKIYLNAGMASFSVSSALYIVAIILIWNELKNFTLACVGSFVIGLLFATVVLLLAKPLKLDFSGFKVQTLVYSTLVATAGILSLFICFFVHWFAIFAVGVLLVLISDLVLSLMYFGGKADSKALCIINHILYYFGELLVVAYLFFQLG